MQQTSSVYDIATSRCPLLFISVLVSVSAFMALSTVFQSINSPNNTPLSRPVLPVSSLPFWSFHLYRYLFMKVSFLTGLPSRGGDVAVYVFDINQPSFPAPFHSVLVSISVFVALSTVFQSINSPNNSPLSHSVLPVLCLPYWSFQQNISL